MYDIETGRKIVDEAYFDGEIEFDGDNLLFWTATELMKDTICPGPQEWEKFGNRTIVAEKISVDILTLEREHTKQFECRMKE